MRGCRKRKQSTLGYERASNPFFRDQPEAEFVEAILDPVLELPGYYGRMKKINSDGPPVLRDTPNLERLAPNALEKKKQESDAIIVDLRRPEAFGGAHIPGSFNIGAGPNLAMWAAWVLPPDTPILLVGDEQTNLDEAYRSFLRVAMDRVTGSLQGGIQSWIEKGNDQAHIPQVSVRELKQFLDSRNSAMVLDVRSPVEWESGHIPGAIHIPAGELQKRLNEVDTAAPLYVICGSGYRSSIAASILTRTRRLTPINVNGGMAAWRSQNLPEVK